MPKEVETEPGEIHPGFWERTTIEAFKNDPLRIAIELIKNSADSYTRIHRKGEVEPPFEIFVTFICKRSAPPQISVSDHAEGMDSNKLREALKYGTLTSMGEDTQAATSAEKGIGLKDAMMALDDNWLITVKNGLINERNKHPDFTTGIGKKDEQITEEERKQYGISANGTVVVGALPAYFRWRKMETIIDQLQRHFLMRKILQLNDFKICVVDGWTKKKTLLTYSAPPIEKEVLKESFKITYNSKKYDIHLLINKSTDTLSSGKPYGDSGILFYYGEYSVLDFTFCGYDRDLAFSKFFGEAKMEIGELLRDIGEAPLVDAKRRGLDHEHRFNKLLCREINKRLSSIQEKEEATKYTFDENALKDALKELNKLYTEIKGRGAPPRPPIEPETFAFHPPHISIKEYEQKTVFLIINSDIIGDGLEISIQSTNPDIIAKKKYIKIDKAPEDDFVIQQIPLYSEKPEITGEILAKSILPPNLDVVKMGVEVFLNPMFSPTDDFEFVPDKTAIVDGGQKKVDLCINRSLIGGHAEISLSSEGPIRCPGVYSLPQGRNLEPYLVKNIAKIEIPLETRGKENIGEKATIKASYKDRSSLLDVTIVPEPAFGGLFRGIKPSPKETKKISDFNRVEGVLEFYYKHPLIKKYMKKDFMNKSEFLVFVADVLTREAVKTVVSSGIEENSSRFRILDLEKPDFEIEQHVNREYFEQGPAMHELFLKLLRGIQL